MKVRMYMIFETSEGYLSIDRLEKSCTGTHSTPTVFLDQPEAKDSPSRHRPPPPPFEF